MTIEIIQYLKNPSLKPKELLGFKKKLKFFIILTFIYILVLYTCSILVDLFTDRNSDLKSNNITDFSIVLFFVGTLVISPILEEMAFRLPLRLSNVKLKISVISFAFILIFWMNFEAIISYNIIKILLRFCLFLLIISLFIWLINRKKVFAILNKIWINKFNFIFYSQIFIFTIIHLHKFNINFRDVLILIQIIILAFLASYIRMKIGVIWGIIFHSIHNLSLIIPILVYSFLFSPYEEDNVRELQNRVYELEQKKDSLESIIKSQEMESKTNSPDGADL